MNTGIQTIGQTTARINDNRIIGTNLRDETKIGNTTWKFIKESAMNESYQQQNSFFNLSEEDSDLLKALRNMEKKKRDNI